MKYVHTFLFILSWKQEYAIGRKQFIFFLFCEREIYNLKMLKDLIEENSCKNLNMKILAH